MSENVLPESDPRVQLVEKSLRDLSEFFDSVHIVCTRKDHDNDGSFTDTISRGLGNAEARYGSLKATVIRLEEQMRWKMRRALEDEG
jgi:hypothetical protein